MYVVSLLLDFLFPPREHARLVRTATTDQLSERLAPASFSLQGTEALGLLSYRDPLVRATLLEAKFHNNLSAQKLLGEVLTDYLLEYSAEETAFGQKIALVPVPLGEKRKKERGHNQVETICRLAIENTGISVVVLPKLLKRTRETLPQTQLSGDARRENMRDAFVAEDIPNDDYTYIVVDDVLTTGATLLAATQAVRASGATSVSALALAH